MPTFKQELLTTPSSNEKQARLFAQGFTVLDWPQNKRGSKLAIVVENFMTNIRGTLIGVYNADGGLRGELAYVFGHLIRIRSCSLCDISHSLIKKKAAFKELEQHLLAEHGIIVRMIHLNERNERETKASEGREPCMLLEYPDQSISMFLDSTDLKALSGRVSSLKKLITSRLDLYL